MPTKRHPPGTSDGGKFASNPQPTLVEPTEPLALSGNQSDRRKDVQRCVAAFEDARDAGADNGDRRYLRALGGRLCDLMTACCDLAESGAKDEARQSLMDVLDRGFPPIPMGYLDSGTYRRMTDVLSDPSKYSRAKQEDVMEDALEPLPG